MNIDINLVSSLKVGEFIQVSEAEVWLKKAWNNAD